MEEKCILVNKHTVKLERLIPHPIESVWQYFVDKDKLSHWLMPAYIDNEPGGLIEYISEPVPEGVADGHELEPHECAIHGMISEYEPPHVLEYSWNESSYASATQFRIELSEKDGKTHLILVHSHLDPEFMAAVAAGWHIHIESVMALLRGEEKPDFMPRFNELLPEYKAMIAAAGIVAVASTASPAMATELSDSAYKQVKAQRHELLKKYDRLWKDAKHLRQDITRLEKMSNPDKKAIDSLYRDLKFKKKDMHKIELDVRDLDKVLH